MKRAIVLLVVCWSGLVMLQGCSLPLVGSITGNSLTAAVTGNYERSLVNGGIDLIVHQKTGKTTSQHLYQVAETKYTEKVLKKHFPNKKITIKDFKLGYNNTTHPIIGPTQASEILNFKSTTHPIIGHDRASDILNFKTSDRQDLLDYNPVFQSARYIKTKLFTARVSSKNLIRRHLIR